MGENQTVEVCDECNIALSYHDISGVCDVSGVDSEERAEKIWNGVERLGLVSYMEHIESKIGTCGCCKAKGAELNHKYAH